MKLTPFIAGALIILASLTGCNDRDITPGGACSFEGEKHTNSDGYNYTCLTVPGGNRIWQQDAPLTPDRP